MKRCDESSEQASGAQIVEPIFSKTPKEKLRIGYLSVDFRDHPVSQLVAGLFENHDRNKFEIFAFSAGPNTIDDYQKRIVKAADQFFRVEKLSTPDLVKLMGEKQLDIAVDLSGYTTLTRSAIFAGHVAPVQVNYLGYSGTMGDEFMDYIIGDATIIPPDHQNDYAEKIVYMPNSYMPSDNSRIMSDRIFKRRELGLPEKGVVYCAFNNVTKLNPDCFSSWMRILKAVAGSVLWLNVKGTTARENLAKEAAARGIDPSRLIYTTYLASDEHFARYRSADIFLDSLPYNAHTTANEALWSGLPVLTQIGEAFAGRVAASLLKTVGLDELITHSKEEFETKAIALSLQPSEFERLKSQLAQNLKSSPLFNASLYARHIEDAFQQMHQRHVQGLRPDHIFINS